MLTGNGTHFTTPGNICSAAAEMRHAMDAGERFRAHSFEYAYVQNRIDHRLTKPRHQWTNDQVGQMNRMLKNAAVKRYHDESHDQFCGYLGDSVTAYNCARRLKTLKNLIRYKFICKTWTAEPDRFSFDPIHQIPGLNTCPAFGRRHTPPCAASTGKAA